MSSASFPRYDNQVFTKRRRWAASGRRRIRLQRQRHAQCRNRLCDRQQHTRHHRRPARPGPAQRLLGYDQLNASRLLQRAQPPPRAPTSSALIRFHPLKIAVATTAWPTAGSLAGAFATAAAWADWQAPDVRFPGTALQPIIALAVPTALSGHAFASWQRTDINTSRRQAATPPAKHTAWATATTFQAHRPVRAGLIPATGPSSTAFEPWTRACVIDSDGRHQSCCVVATRLCRATRAIPRTACACGTAEKMTEHAARGDRIRNLNVGCLSNGGFKLGWQACSLHHLRSHRARAGLAPLIPYQRSL